MSPSLMRRKLPELFLEAAMIFFAVMLALAAEEWSRSVRSATSDWRVARLTRSSTR